MAAVEELLTSLSRCGPRGEEDNVSRPCERAFAQ